MNPASPSPPLSFPDWPAALSRLPLKELERGAYRAALTSYLRFCKQTRQRATVGSARQFMVQVQERRRLGVSQLTTWKGALNWFFKAGANQRVRPQPVQPATAVASTFAKAKVPSLAAADLGGPEWERKLIRALRERHYQWRTEQAYRMWAGRWVKWLETQGRYQGNVFEAQEADVRDFLSDLATRHRVAVATQRQALNALVFLVREALGRTLGDFGDFERAHKPRRMPVLPVKFVGGWLAISGGLALGREGPSVQMGACLGSEIGRWLRLEKSDLGALLAAGAGAGLATAFNAPIAGAIFVLEELVRRFDTRMAIAALGASAGAIAVSRLFLGDNADFKVGALPYPPDGSGLLFLAMGVLAGFVGMTYNRLLLGTLALSDRWAHRPIELRAALIGACVGALAWFAPGLVGGGDALTQNALNAGATGSAALLLVFVLRFVLGAASYAAGTPGGLFAPMLVLGAQLGLLFAWLCQSALPGINVSPTAFAVVGMAAFFTAVVRAPVTGIILTVELTGKFTQLLPMLWACFAAMAVPTLFGDKPIYVSLKERTLRLQA